MIMHIFKEGDRIRYKEKMRGIISMERSIMLMHKISSIFCLMPTRILGSSKRFLFKT